MGAGGKVEQHWLEERYNWLHEDGTPKQPDWTEQDNMQELEDMKYQSYCDKYEEEHDILVTADQQNLIHSAYAALQQHPKERERKFRKKLEQLTEAGEGLMPLTKGEQKDVHPNSGLKRGRAKMIDALKEVSGEYVERNAKRRKLLNETGYDRWETHG